MNFFQSGTEAAFVAAIIALVVIMLGTGFFFGYLIFGG